MQRFLLFSVKVPQMSLIQVTLTQRQNFFLGPSFLQKVSCPLVLHRLRAVRLFIQSGSDVPSLLSRVYAVNHAAGCSKLEVPSIQRRGTYISLHWVESPRKKKPSRSSAALTDYSPALSLPAKSVSCSPRLRCAKTQAASTRIQLMKTLPAADRHV